MRIPNAQIIQKIAAATMRLVFGPMIAKILPEQVPH